MENEDNSQRRWWSAAEARDQAADARDDAADERDAIADRRDRAGEKRDVAANERDLTADRRDRAAQLADHRQRAVMSTDEDALERASTARREAAFDRSRSSLDRGVSAHERAHAGIDRKSASADRGESAKDRDTSFIDDLTGVYARAAGFVELEREMGRASRSKEPLVLAFVDVDDLKGINDSRGHAAGDQMLIGVAQTLRAQLRSHDLIFRYGGDEFVCVISGMEAADTIERLAVVNTVLADVHGHGSVTVGVAQLQPDDSPEDLVSRADAALYRERHQRRGTPT